MSHFENLTYSNYSIWSHRVIENLVLPLTRQVIFIFEFNPYSNVCIEVKGMKGYT